MSSQGQQILNPKPTHPVQSLIQDQNLRDGQDSTEKQPLHASPTIHRYKSFKSLAIIILNISLSSFYFGYSIAYLSSVDFDTIKEVYDITWDKQLAQGLLVGCVPIGGGIGALSSSILIARFSRRQCLMLVNAVALVFGLLVYVPSFWTLLICRIFQGICAGTFSALAPMIMKELSPNEISGTLTNFNQIGISFGVFFAYLFSLIIQSIAGDNTGRSTWQISFGFTLITIITQTVILKYIFKFQTPKYLLLKGKESEARELLQHIYMPEHVDGAMQQLKNNLEITDQGAREAQKNVQKQSTQQKTPKLAIFAAIHLASLQQFCGINAVVAYAGEIIGQLAPSMKLAIPSLINLQQCLCSLLTSYLLTRLGRKQLLQGGCVAAFIACGITGLGFALKDNNSDGDPSELSLVLTILGLVAFMAMFGLTLGPIVWLYLAEIVQPGILPYATMTNWACASFVMILFPTIKKNLPGENPAMVFFFFSAWCLGSFFLNMKVTIETKGKGEKQIAAEFESKKSLC